ncbi:UNVERIFIED_CONTAM: hypothetical protein K2H54_015161 [Gekko kuhli]
MDLPGLCQEVCQAEKLLERMFHKATKSLAKQLDPDGDLIPVRCFLDQNHFRPLCLVQKKCRNSWWQKSRYQKTDYKLPDVLLPGEPASQPDIYDSDSFTIVDHVDGKLEGAVNAVTNLTPLELKSTASMSHARSVKVKKRHIGAQVLDSLHGKSKINLDHPLIKQSKKFQKDLYIVTETVETVEEAEFRDSSKTEGNILAELPLKTKFTGLRDSKKAVIIPKACALAFRVKELIIQIQAKGPFVPMAHLCFHVWRRGFGVQKVARQLEHGAMGNSQEMVEWAEDQLQEKGQIERIKDRLREMLLQKWVASLQVVTNDENNHDVIL